MKSTHFILAFGLLLMVSLVGCSDKVSQQNTRKISPVINPNAHIYWRDSTQWKKQSNIATDALELRKTVQARLKEGANDNRIKSITYDAKNKELRFIDDGTSYRIREESVHEYFDYNTPQQRLEHFDVLHIWFETNAGCSNSEKGEIVIEFASDYCTECIKAYYNPTNIRLLSELRGTEQWLDNFWRKHFGSLEKGLDDRLPSGKSVRHTVQL